MKPIVQKCKCELPNAKFLYMFVNGDISETKKNTKSTIQVNNVIVQTRKCK